MLFVGRLMVRPTFYSCAVPCWICGTLHIGNQRGAFHMTKTNALALPIDLVEHVNDEGMLLREYEHPMGFRIAALINGDPEMFAALGATLSRNPMPLRERFTEVTPKQRNRIIGKFFRDYGHSSIGEMGHLMIAVEDVSMYGALRTIEFPRFQGQEASTRYIDFSDKPKYLLPSTLWCREAVESIVERWFCLYRDVLNMLREEFEKQGMESKDAEPKAYDIAGAFLPLSACTSVVLTCDIRNLIEHAWEMQSHEGYSEVIAIGGHLLRVINHLCPNSVKKERSIGELGLRAMLRDRLARHARSENAADNLTRFFWPHVSFDLFDKAACFPAVDNILRVALDSRLSDDFLGRFGMIRCTGMISMRSLRDLWRHRPFAKAFWIAEERGHVPLEFGFARWYLDQIPEAHRVEVGLRVNELLGFCRLRADVFSPEGMLYFLPMGVKVYFEMNGTLDKWLYLLRLRSGVRVHPEVRSVVHQWIRGFESNLEVSASRFGDMTNETNYAHRSEDK